MNDFQTNRRTLLAAGGGFLLTGCEGLDFSAAGEGTGVQVVGAIVVLARYRATAQQKAVAERRARAVIVVAAKPAYEKRRAAIVKESQKRISTLEREHARHTADETTGGATSVTDGTSGGASHSAASGTYRRGRRAGDGATAAAPSATGKIGSAMAIQERRRQEEMARVKAEAAAKLAAVDTAWRSMGGAVAQPVKSSEPPDPTAARVAQMASLDDRNAMLAALTAEVPRYIAVPVPAQGIAAEKGGKAVVMIVDARTQQVASNDALVVDRPLAAGKDVKLDGVTARVAGN